MDLREVIDLILINSFIGLAIRSVIMLTSLVCRGGEYGAVVAEVFD